MKRYIVAASAQREILEIFTWIKTDNPLTAREFERELDSAFEMLAEHPGIGHRRRDLTRKRVLFWPVMKRAFAIVYRRSKPVEILHVVRWRRDLTHLLY